MYMYIDMCTHLGNNKLLLHDKRPFPTFCFWGLAVDSSAHLPNTESSYIRHRQHPGSLVQGSRRMPATEAHIQRVQLYWYDGIRTSKMYCLSAGGGIYTGSTIVS